MHLTPVARFVVRGYVSVSADGSGISRLVRGRCGVPGLSRQTTVAGGVPLPEMSGGGSLGHGAGLASLPGMRSADLGDGGDLVRGQKSGASALGLQRVLGLGSYHTAWNLLHKLRRAMVRPGRERLQGIIEVDEIFIGGPRPGKRGRGAQGKALVVVAT